MERYFQLTRVLFLITALLCIETGYADTRETIDVILSQRHPTDTRETWVGLGADAPDVMLAMLAEGEQSYRRIRLIEALGYFQNSRVSEFLRKEAREAKNDLYKKAALHAIVKSEGDSGVEFAKDFPEEKPMPPPAVMKPLKATGTSEGKPELEYLGAWEGIATQWNQKTKKIESTKIEIVFDQLLGGAQEVRVKRDPARKAVVTDPKKEKWDFAVVKVRGERLLRVYSPTDFWSALLLEKSP